jgi:murein DD-endopeptidase MepM/ murein hydrolase activator NlpD
MRRAHVIVFRLLVVSCAVLALPTVLLVLTVLAVPAGAEAEPADWRWPVEGGRTVIRRFDPPAQPWLAGHRGVDVAARPGAQIRAAGAGTVAFAGSAGGRGAVTIVHPEGLRTTYLPVHPKVRPGQAVAAGEIIGVLEHVTGHCRMACLHWGLLRGERYLDPLVLFGAGEVRLLPRWGGHLPLRLTLRARSRMAAAPSAVERTWSPSAVRPVPSRAPSRPAARPVPSRAWSRSSVPVSAATPSSVPLGRHAVPAGAAAAFLVGTLAVRRVLRGRPGHGGLTAGAVRRGGEPGGRRS